MMSCRWGRQAADRFGVIQDTVRTDHTLYRSQGLPLTRPTAEKFIKAAYYASLIPDEGRWPSTCLMCYRSESAFQFHTLSDEPREPTADEIAKLAHAVDTTRRSAPSAPGSSAAHRSGRRATTRTSTSP